ncbi:MAG: hypothetical protein ACR2LN_06895 [Candidatus Levyibacteriota bacterium]
MKFFKNNWYYFFTAIIIFVVFKNWFVLGTISGGDFIYEYPSMFGNRTLFPYAWDWNATNGLGGFAAPLQWVNTVYAIPILLFGVGLHLSWNIIERVGFFYPYLLIGLLSSWYLARSLFGKSSFWILTPSLFLINTYALMMSGGGQIVGVGLAYAIAPFVLARFINLLDQTAEKKNNLRNAVQFGLAFSLLTLFDIRFAYVLFVAIIIYLLLHYKKSFADKGKNLLYLILIPFGLTILIHAYWLLPLLLVHQAPTQALDVSYNSTNAVSFFSFARFENTISLLHPNWPENIFGKVSFMKPEFLIIPLLAFTSLLFISKKKKDESNFVIYFALIGLLGAFLAKGSTDPFGFIYLWLFNHFPGFSMFRDPTKWYTLVAISYSILIPYTIWKIYECMKELKKLSVVHFQKLFLLITIGYLLFLIRAALLGQLTGTLAHHSVPTNYQILARSEQGSNMFYRTLWFPTTQRYGYSSLIHPSVSAQDLFKIYDHEKLLSMFQQNKTEETVEDLGVRYIIVPDDSEKEIFLQSRYYSEELYQNTYATLRKIKWLHEVKGFGRIKVFALVSYKNHFWSPDKTMQVTNTMVTPVDFKVSVKNAKKDDTLIFAESYDQHWVATINDEIIQSTKYKNIINSFNIPKDGNYNLEVTYQSQRWILSGVIVTVVSLVISFYLLFYLKRK